MKKLFLDSANLDEIKLIAATDAISGVTTNPSLMAKETKGNYFSKLRMIAQILKDGKKREGDSKHLSVEVVTLDVHEMEKQAWDLYKELSEYKLDLYVKIPFMMHTLPLITTFAGMGVHVNATACMTAEQAFIARQAGAPIVSFFYNRMKDGGLDADEELYRFEYDYDNYGHPCQVICGSIREPEDIINCWKNGADIVTAPMHVIKKFMHHDKTVEAIVNFQKDIDEWLS